MQDSSLDYRIPQVASQAKVAVVDARFPARSLPTDLYRRYAKRAVDLFLCLIILPAVVFMIAVLWFLIRRDGGPGFFAQQRVGAGGQRFWCWKLRTMRMDSAEALAAHLAGSPAAAAEWARDHKLRDDPRITRLGRRLRRTSLDELPQIWNVLRGEMSLVGPRPIVAEELDRYGRHAGAYLAGRPGVTGLWQVSGRNDISYDERVALDLRYRRETTLAGDLSIIARTAGAVLWRTGC